MIHIALALYDKYGDYCRHTATVMVSILENTKSKICFHLLHDDTLIDNNKIKLSNLAKRYEQNIEFYHISVCDDFEICKYNFIKNYSKASLYRLYLAEVLKNVDKVIYFDSDVVCNLDIKLLWNENIQGKALGAINLKNALGIFCNDIIKTDFTHEFYKKINIMNENYFNSGVLVFNLVKIREYYNLKDECIDFLNMNPDSPFPDNDSLNYIFQNDCTFLDGKYNKLVYYFKLYEKDYLLPEKWKGVCWHFSGNKPWDVKCYNIDLIYWEFFHLTPWGGIEGVLKYSNKIGNSLEDSILHYPIKNKKILFRNILKRLCNKLYSKRI